LKVIFFDPAIRYTNNIVFNIKYNYWNWESVFINGLHENVLSLYVCLLLCPESQRNVHKKTVMLILLRIRVFIYYKLIFMSQMLLLKIKEWLVMGFISSALYGWSIQIYQPTPFRGCHHVTVLSHYWEINFLWRIRPKTSVCSIILCVH
jgi:hypothetical protein